MLQGRTIGILLLVAALAFGSFRSASAQTTIICTPAVATPEPEFTGLIVAANGFRLARSMAPAVLSLAGEVVYGRGWFKPGSVGADVTINQGVLGYSHSIESATRAGARPLVVKAIAVGGPPQSDVKVDVVITNEDAVRIRTANARTQFLERFAVSVVMDR